MTALRQQSRNVVGRIAATTLLVVAVTGGWGGTPADAAPLAGREWPVPVLLGHTDDARAEQWQLEALHASDAWRVSTGQGVVVAVVDSGVDVSHPDLAGQVLPGLDLVSEFSDGRIDPVGHGTTVAALIAGRRDDDHGAVGLAPDALILPVRVLDSQNRYDDALVVARGVRWAVDNGARVINLSLGGSADSEVLAAALDYAFARDVVVVACTGNRGTVVGDDVWYPAREPGVVAVTGLDRDADQLWSGAVTGPATVLAAPATSLVGARPGGGYWRVQGTSFASPLVAAAAALLRARWPDMPAGEVVNRLLATADDLGTPGRDDQFGYGRIDPVAALNGEVARVDRNPLDDESSPGEAGFGAAPRIAADAAQGRTTSATTVLTHGGPWNISPVAQIQGGGGAADPWAGIVLFALLFSGSTLTTRRFRRTEGPPVHDTTSGSA